VVNNPERAILTMTKTHYLAFWSYARIDDENSDAKLSWLYNSLKNEVHSLSGYPHEIFQDVHDIVIGQDWDSKLHEGLQDAEFLIPIITPSFLASSACRAEVEAFLEREHAENTHDLILPIYWIDAPAIGDPAKASTDYLARIIKKRQWGDWRNYRYEPKDNPDLGKAMGKLAKAILSRRDANELRILNDARVTGSISWPRNRQMVTRENIANGTVSGPHPRMELWTVVAVGGKLHPQSKLSPGTDGEWNGKVRIGSVSARKGESYLLELALVTSWTSSDFDLYLNDANKTKKWPGVARQQGYRTLDAITLIRDDTAAMKSIAGSYDELAPGPTGVTVTITSTSDASEFMTASSKEEGTPGWSGSLKIDRQIPDRASGEYRYEGTGHGLHEFLLDRALGEVLVKGQDAKGNTKFETTWRKKK
jgi:hypothetical protein